MRKPSPDWTALPPRPGVYRMLDSEGQILYVGKAKDLKKRVTSYFRKTLDSAKTQALAAKIADIQVTVTQTEAEALLLEQTLIKEHRPPYNIVLKDDKSYPYIYLSDHEYPRICFYRGALNKPGIFYGPFVSSGAVRETLNLLQKVFQVRQCEDAFFKNRSRPCLQHQIHRCSAPCVKRLSREAYMEDVKHTQLFLEGDASLVTQLAWEMEQASNELAFEKAAVLRDQIAALKKVQSTQHVAGVSGNADVIAASHKGASVCVNVLHVRAGNVVGQKSYVFNHDEPDNTLNEFVVQFYFSTRASTQLPKEIITGIPLEDETLIREELTKKAGHKIRITACVRGERAAWLKLSALNAEQHLEGYLSSRKNSALRVSQLQADLDLPEIPKRLECFDISHTQGEKTQASCVVFDQNGPVKSDYRRFNIEGIEPGDDYAAIEQAVMRRYRRLKQEEAVLPDVIIIDGGKGQLNMAGKALQELQFTDVVLLSIAKGPTRKAGFETFFIWEQGKGIREFLVKPASLSLLLQIRDEAHRFAITGHRHRRDKVRKKSKLEDIPGIGAKRRKLLLTHFGGLQGLKNASIEDIAQLSGVSRKMAEDIYSVLS